MNLLLLYFQGKIGVIFCHPREVKSFVTNLRMSRVANQLSDQAFSFSKTGLSFRS